MRTIYGDYVAIAIASHGGPWHIQGEEDDLTLCGKRIKVGGRMRLHVSHLECPRCKDLGGR